MDHKALLKWALGRGAGASAKCMARHFMGMESDGSYPHDGGDFNRCEGLLNDVPELRDRLGEMAEVNRYWSALVPRWDEIRETALDAKFELIREILDPIHSADRNHFNLGPGVSMRFGKP